MPVRVEKQGPITTVVLSRPDVKNAVDRATADELAAAFQAFDRDDEARVREEGAPSVRMARVDDGSVRPPR